MDQSYNRYHDEEQKHLLEVLRLLGALAPRDNFSIDALVTQVELLQAPMIGVLGDVGSGKSTLLSKLINLKPIRRDFQGEIRDVKSVDFLPTSKLTQSTTTFPTTIEVWKGEHFKICFLLSSEEKIEEVLRQTKDEDDDYLSNTLRTLKIEPHNANVQNMRNDCTDDVLTVEMNDDSCQVLRTLQFLMCRWSPKDMDRLKKMKPQMYLDDLLAKFGSDETPYWALLKRVSVFIPTKLTDLPEGITLADTAGLTDPAGFGGSKEILKRCSAICVVSPGSKRFGDIVKIISGNASLLQEMPLHIMLTKQIELLEDEDDTEDELEDQRNDVKRKLQESSKEGLLPASLHFCDFRVKSKNTYSSSFEIIASIARTHKTSLDNLKRCIEARYATIIGETKAIEEENKRFQDTENWNNMARALRTESESIFSDLDNKNSPALLKWTDQVFNAPTIVRQAIARRRGASYTSSAEDYKISMFNIKVSGQGKLIYFNNDFCFHLQWIKSLRDALFERFRKIWISAEYAPSCLDWKKLLQQDWIRFGVEKLDCVSKNFDWNELCKKQEEITIQALRTTSLETQSNVKNLIKNFTEQFLSHYFPIYRNYSVLSSQYPFLASVAPQEILKASAKEIFAMMNMTCQPISLPVPTAYVFEEKSVNAWDAIASLLNYNGVSNPNTGATAYMWCEFVRQNNPLIIVYENQSHHEFFELRNNASHALLADGDYPFVIIKSDVSMGDLFSSWNGEHFFLLENSARNLNSISTTLSSLSLSDTRNQDVPENIKTNREVKQEPAKGGANQEPANGEANQDVNRLAEQEPANGEANQEPVNRLAEQEPANGEANQEPVNRPANHEPANLFTPDIAPLNFDNGISIRLNIRMNDNQSIRDYWKEMIQNELGIESYVPPPEKIDLTKIRCVTVYTAAKRKANLHGRPGMGFTGSQDHKLSAEFSHFCTVKDGTLILNIFKFPCPSEDGNPNPGSDIQRQHSSVLFRQLLSLPSLHVIRCCSKISLQHVITWFGYTTSYPLGQVEKIRVDGPPLYLWGTYHPAYCQQPFISSEDKETLKQITQEHYQEFGRFLHLNWPGDGHPQVCAILGEYNLVSDDIAPDVVIGTNPYIPQVREQTVIASPKVPENGFLFFRGPRRDDVSIADVTCFEGVNCQELIKEYPLPSGVKYKLKFGSRESALAALKILNYNRKHFHQKYHPFRCSFSLYKMNNYKTAK